MYYSRNVAYKSRKNVYTIHFKLIFESRIKAIIQYISPLVFRLILKMFRFLLAIFKPINFVHLLHHKNIIQFIYNLSYINLIFILQLANEINFITQNKIRAKMEKLRTS